MVRLLLLQRQRFPGDTVMSRDVLLVEANPSVSKLIFNIFHDQVPEVHVQVAATSSDALDYLFRTGPFVNRNSPVFPALIMLDLNLPQTSGLSLLEIIKTYARTRVIPIVMIAESTDTYSVSDGYRRGASAWLVKSGDRQRFINDVIHTAIYWMKVNGAVPAEGPTGAGSDGSVQA